MILNDALQKLRTTFPWPQYFDVGLDAHANVAKTVQKLQPNGGKILDVGCGPMDKTAVLAALGYTCTATDDLADPWHRRDDNLNKITQFGKQAGINFILDEAHTLPVPDNTYDIAMACDVLEHLHDSPKDMLEAMITKVKTGGYVLITVPNAVNIRKRLAVMRSKTNLPPYEAYFHYPKPWRGHVREYVADDLAQMGAYMGLEPVILTGAHHMIAKIPPLARPVYKLLTAIFPSMRDSWLYVGRKPNNWHMPAYDFDAVPHFIK